MAIEKVQHSGIGGFLAKLSGGSPGDDPLCLLVEHDHALAEAQDGGQLLGDEDHRRADPLVDAPDEDIELCRRHGIGQPPVAPAGRYEFSPGEEMQHDTSPHEVRLGGKKRKVQTASAVLCYSRMLFFQCYPTFQRFDCKVFLTEALRYFCGAARRVMIDNTHVVVLRGSGRHDGRPLQLLSAVTHHLRLTLDQVAIQEKTNEIPALKPLLKKLELPPGTLITADAMHCQQESARFITQELGGDYLFGLKGNQSGVLDKAQRLLAQQGFPPSGHLGERTRTL